MSRLQHRKPTPGTDGPRPSGLGSYALAALVVALLAYTFAAHMIEPGVLRMLGCITSALSGVQS